MDTIMTKKEANLLADQGIKELIIIAQDTTKYGEDIYGTPKLPELLKELQDQNVTKEMLGLSSMIQYGPTFGLVLASIGIFLSKKFANFFA